MDIFWIKSDKNCGDRFEWGIHKMIRVYSQKNNRKKKLWKLWIIIKKIIILGRFFIYKISIL